MVLAIWLTFYVILSILKKFTVLSQAKLGFSYSPEHREVSVMIAHVVSLANINVDMHIVIDKQNTPTHIFIFEKYKNVYNYI